MGVLPRAYNGVRRGGGDPSSAQANGQHRCPEGVTKWLHMASAWAHLGQSRATESLTFGSLYPKWCYVFYSSGNGSPVANVGAFMTPRHANARSLDPHVHSLAQVCSAGSWDNPYASSKVPPHHNS